MILKQGGVPDLGASDCKRVRRIRKTDRVIDLTRDLESEGNRKCENERKKTEGESEEGGEQRALSHC